MSLKSARKNGKNGKNVFKSAKNKKVRLIQERAYESQKRKEKREKREKRVHKRQKQAVRLVQDFHKRAYDSRKRGLLFINLVASLPYFILFHPACLSCSPSAFVTVGSFSLVVGTSLSPFHTCN
jgi:hypothetical protein